MAKSTPPYERLTRARFGLNGTGSLWLGNDHLLQVTNRFAVERYRRWYLRDIQALVLRRTAARMIWNIVTLISAVVFLLIAAACGIRAARVGGPDDQIILTVFACFFGTVGAGFLAIALINTVMGPSCSVYIQTPHGLDRISSPTRLPVFEKIAARLRPILESVQATAGNEGLRDIAAALDQPTA